MSDASEDRDPQETRRKDERRENQGLPPADVARRIFGPDPRGVEGLEGTRSEIAEAQRRLILAAGFLPVLPYPATFDARGTEHVVRFRGLHVEKHQRSDGWVPLLSPSGKLEIQNALPTEYLRRLELQNELFGDHVRVIGCTRGHRFATIQPTLRGGEPGENEIRDLLQEAGWLRVPIAMQELPIQLMGSAWWHPEEALVLVDARKPNFKRTTFGVLPIDLVLADLTPEMRERFS